MCAKPSYAGPTWGQCGYSHRQAAATARGREPQSLAGPCSLSESLLFCLLNISEIVICVRGWDISTVTAVLSVFPLRLSFNEAILPIAYLCVCPNNGSWKCLLFFRPLLWGFRFFYLILFIYFLNKLTTCLQCWT